MPDCAAYALKEVDNVLALSEIIQGVEMANVKKCDRTNGRRVWLAYTHTKRASEVTEGYPGTGIP